MLPFRASEANTKPVSLRGRKAFARLWGDLAPYLGSNRRRMALFVLASLVGGLGEALLLYTVVRIATTIAAGEQRALVTFGSLPQWRVDIGMLFAGSFLLILVMLAVGLASAVLTARMSVVALDTARQRTFDSFLVADWGLQSRERDGQLQELLTTHAKRISTGVTVLATGIAAALGFVALLASALVISPAAAALVLLGVGALYCLLRPLSRLTRSKSREHVAGNSRYAVSVTQAAGLAREIRAFDVSDSVRRDITAEAHDVGRLHFATRLLAQLGPYLYRNAALLLVVTCMLLVYSFDLGDLSNLAAVVLLFVRALSHSQTLQASIQQANEVAPYLEHLQRQQQLYLASAVRSGSTPLATVQSISFSDVGFGYEPESPVLRHVSFEIRGGETIGIVGASGAGKSTLVQLLLRLRRPDIGEYRVNGEFADDYTSASWYRQIVFVPQSNQLLRASVADNVRFHRRWITDDDIQRAIRLAHLHEETMLLPHGYDTLIGSGAMDLSGGQRQRLGLARALAGSPSVLILDEPTSALDMRSEELIQQTFEELRGTLTLLIVAHRMTTLNRSDRLMVLGGGGIEAFATPEELARSNDFFQDTTRLSRIAW